MYNLSAVVVPLKPGTVTVTLTYAGYKVGSREVTLCYPPSDWAYWEPGAYHNLQRFPLIKEFKKWINDWVAKNITDGMSEYDKAVAVANHVKTCMLYDSKNAETRKYEDTLKSWKEGLGVCCHAAHITSLFLTKIGIENTINNTSIYGEGHVNNWAVLEGQAYIIDATFLGTNDRKNHDTDCSGEFDEVCNHKPKIYKTDMTKEEAETPK